MKSSIELAYEGNLLNAIVLDGGKLMFFLDYQEVRKVVNVEINGRVE